MLQQLINHNLDIRKLQEKGYNLEVSGGQYLLAHQIPYVNSKKEVKQGILVCTLTLTSPTRLGKPNDHTIFFCGETPCDFNGKPLTSIINSSATRQLSQNIVVNHYFSSKPLNGKYENYFEKVNTYATILSSYAHEVINNQLISEEL